MRFGSPVAYVYRPLDYAWPVARTYLTRFGAGSKEAVLVGMNPGPFGMAQTGVPFGEVAMVRDWMGLAGDIAAPKKSHPKRPVLGWRCPRSEVSGKRLWGAVAALHPEPESFFARAFVMNYCPLMFVGETGANITPDKLVRTERSALEAACDAHLASALSTLGPRYAIGVGQYAMNRIARVVESGAVRAGPNGLPRVLCIPHPSPASPAANRGWNVLAQAALHDAGVRGLL